MQPKAKSAARLPDTLHPRNRRVQAQSLMEQEFWRHFRDLVSEWNPVFDSGGAVRSTFVDDAPPPGEGPAGDRRWLVCACKRMLHKDKCPPSLCYFGEKRWPRGDGAISKEDRKFLDNLNPRPVWWATAYGRRPESK